MDTSIIITIIGTILTAIGTFVTIYYSFVVKKYKKEILAELYRVNLIEVSGFLKDAQNETRKLLYPNPQLSRGRKKEEIINSIQKHIDDSLAIINLDESDKVLRQKISESQQKLRDYVQPNKTPEKIISDFHEILQDCISIAKSSAIKIIG